MRDLERLDEALEIWRRHRRIGTVPPKRTMNRIVGAAKAYRDLLANGERVEWCEKHRSDGVPRLTHDPTTCWKAEFTKHLDAKDCRIVHRLLVDPTTEDSE